MSKYYDPVGQPAEKVTVDLSVFDAEYEAVQIPAQNEVPDGKYRVRVEDVKLVRSTKGCPLLKWNLLILTGQFSGWHIFKDIVITAASLPIIKSDLIALGLHLEKISSLPHHLESLFGKTLEVSKRTKGDFMNVYFHKKSRNRSDSQVADDSIPF